MHYLPRPNARRPLALLALVALLTAPAAVVVAEEVVAEGSWTRKGYAIEGSWKIVQDEKAVRVVLSDDFKTRKAPDLKIFLSPTGLDDLDNRNATRGSVLVAPLSSAKGGQSYDLPEGVDWKTFRTVLIHCERYSKLWGGAELPVAGR